MDFIFVRSDSFDMVPGESESLSALKVKGVRGVFGSHNHTTLQCPAMILVLPYEYGFIMDGTS